MDLKFTFIWVGLIIAGCVLEGVALFNRGRGDTLSEHLWVWLGTKNEFWHRDRENPSFISKHGNKLATPKWTVRVARTAFIFFCVWFVLHIVTGGWV